VCVHAFVSVCVCIDGSVNRWADLWGLCVSERLTQLIKMEMCSEQTVFDLTTLLCALINLSHTHTHTHTPAEEA